MATSIAEANATPNLSPEEAHRSALAAAAARRESISLWKELVAGLTLGLIGGAIWKMYHWNMRRNIQEYYAELAQGKISPVVKDDE
eukprot:jgi/Chlat1/5791/Chrsp387S09020